MTRSRSMEPILHKLLPAGNRLSWHITQGFITVVFVDPANRSLRVFPLRARAPAPLLSSAARGWQPGAVANMDHGNGAIFGYHSKEDAVNVRFAPV